MANFLNIFKYLGLHCIFRGKTQSLKMVKMAQFIVANHGQNVRFSPILGRGIGGISMYANSGSDLKIKKSQYKHCSFMFNAWVAYYYAV